MKPLRGFCCYCLYVYVIPFFVLRRFPVLEGWLLPYVGEYAFTDREAKK